LEGREDFREVVSVEKLVGGKQKEGNREGRRVKKEKRGVKETENALNCPLEGL